jgi:N-acetylmuramoyl-L-alanine amidase
MSAARTVALCLAFASPTLAAPERPPGLADVRELRVFDHPNYTRVVIETSRGVLFRTGRLLSPTRFYLDLDETWIDLEPARVREMAQGSAVLRLRGGQNTLHRARVVLELPEGTGEPRVFSLSSPPRIVADFRREIPDPAAAPRTLSPGATPPGERVMPHGFDLRPVRRIAIDPGHGGKDPGAISRRGAVREKDVVLRIARELRLRLEREGFEVLLTREDDRFLALEERTAKANAWGADLFVSVHANASPNSATTGIETYLLDTRYDRQTARVAARENGTSVDKLNELQMILASLRLGYQERFAARVADTVHADLHGALSGRYGGTRDHGVKRGPFLVLFLAEMPSVLVEVGFVSNSSEAQRLASADFARAAAGGIARGVARYRDQHARSLVAER